MIVNVLILVSQAVNALALGSPYEMLCSRAWRLRKRPGWNLLVWYFDNASPLMWWKGSYATHCEACYYEERRRLQQRLDEYA